MAKVIAALTPYRYLIAAVALVAVLGGVYVCGRMDGANSVQAALDAERLAAAAAVQRSTERARLVEQQASQSIARAQERTNATLQDLDRRHAAALQRVRNAGTRSGGRDLPRCPAPSAPADADGIVFAADGAVAVPDTLMQDREWLLNLAAEADRVRVALDACRAWADTVQGMTNAE